MDSCLSKEVVLLTHCHSFFKSLLILCARLLIMISPNRAVRGGSLSFSAIKPIDINEGLTPRYIKLSCLTHFKQLEQGTKYTVCVGFVIFTGKFMSMITLLGTIRNILVAWWRSKSYFFLQVK